MPAFSKAANHMEAPNEFSKFDFFSGGIAKDICLAD